MPYDHHAFLHWPATGLAVIPMETWTAQGTAFMGAVGIDVDGGGLTEVGRASHLDDVSGDDSYPMISRSFVANGWLYTVSDAGIEQDDLTTLREVRFLRF